MKPKPLVLIFLLMALFVGGCVLIIYGVPELLAYLEPIADAPKSPSLLPPARILVGPYHWTIKYGKLNPGTFGEDYPKELLILLDSSLPPDQMKETLLHELMHACMFVGDAGKMPGDIEKEHDDTFIEQTAPTLLQVFRDNPELMKWFETKD